MDTSLVLRLLVDTLMSQDVRYHCMLGAVGCYPSMLLDPFALLCSHPVEKHCAIFLVTVCDTTRVT